MVHYPCLYEVVETFEGYDWYTKRLVTCSVTGLFVMIKHHNVRYGAMSAENNEPATPQVSTPVTSSNNDDKLTGIQQSIDNIGKQFSEKIEEVERRLGILESEKTHESTHNTSTTAATGTREPTGEPTSESKADTPTQKDSEPRRQHWYTKRVF
jgi:predicted ribosome quality control (RQC) complex YloA/Tae2 family protein